MAKLAIIYGTGFGNTGIMAKAIGLATYKGAGMPTVIKYVESLSKLPLKGKVGTAFGSYGWSGEGPIVVANTLKGYGMEVLEPPLRVKRIPEAEGIEECKKLGKMIADRIKK